MIFSTPVVDPFVMAEAVKKKREQLGQAEILKETLYETAQPYFEPYIRQEVERKVKETISEMLPFLKSHILWMIALPALSALIVYLIMRKK